MIDVPSPSAAACIGEYCVRYWYDAPKPHAQPEIFFAYTPPTVKPNPLPSTGDAAASTGEPSTRIAANCDESRFVSPVGRFTPAVMIASSPCSRMPARTVMSVNPLTRTVCDAKLPESREVAVPST